MARAAEAFAGRFRESYAIPTDVANVLLEAGHPAGAIAWLEKGYEVRDDSMPYLGMPLYDPLRSNPRLQALVRKTKLSTR